MQVPEVTNPVIDIALFEKIRFQDGMPQILVDMFGLLTGDRQGVRKAFKLLKPSQISNRKQSKSVIKASFSLGVKLMSNLLEKKAFRMMPPLKEFPEEILSDDSANSENTEY